MSPHPSPCLFTCVLEQVRLLLLLLFWWYALLWWLYSSSKSIISETQQLDRSANNLMTKWKERSLIFCHHPQKWPAPSWLLVNHQWRESERRSARVQIEQAHRLYCNQFNSANSKHILQTKSQTRPHIKTRSKFRNAVKKGTVYLFGYVNISVSTRTWSGRPNWFLIISGIDCTINISPRGENWEWEWGISILLQPWKLCW